MQTAQKKTVMGIGNRVKIQLVQFTAAVTDVSGRWTESEGDKFGCWAEATDLSGSRTGTDQKQLENTKRFLVRFRFNKYPSVQWRVRFRGKDWAITKFTQVDEKRFMWDITATSVNDK